MTEITLRSAQEVLRELFTVLMAAPEGVRAK